MLEKQKARKNNRKSLNVNQTLTATSMFFCSIGIRNESDKSLVGVEILHHGVISSHEMGLIESTFKIQIQGFLSLAYCSY